ncbi:hypothetical protein ACGFMO_32685 [Streptomyces niveus]|uniref:hypothetical protein n=1 Tax=Streptomyces niveus TaxID=193462 RepID=UPI00371F9EDB
MQENDGTALDTEGDVAPYSVVQYIAQTNGVPGVPDRYGVTVLAKVNGAAPRITGKLNTVFPYNGDVYSVVPTARLIGGGTPAAGQISAFRISTSKVCAQMAVIQRYGFATIPDCGSIGVLSER